MGDHSIGRYWGSDTRSITEILGVDSAMTYTISRNGEQFGPYSREDVQRYLKDGTLLLTDLVWSTERRGWVNIDDLHFATADAAFGDYHSSRSNATSAASHVVNRFALVCVIVIWLAWFFLPFVTVGWGPIQLANATLWQCLDLTNGLVKFLGLLSISAPIVALFVRNRVAKLLYLCPLLYLGATTAIGLVVLNQLTQTVTEVTRDSPILSAIAQGGLEAVMGASSLDYGAYVFALASLILGFHVFARL